MISLGILSLFLAFSCALYASTASLYGGLRRHAGFIASAEHAAYSVWGLTLIAVVVLTHALITHDFSIAYVAKYSSTTLPLRFCIAALWGGMEGSMLFWVFLLTTLSSIALWQNRERNRQLMPFVTTTVMVVAAFFLGMLVFVTPPFERLAFTPLEGTDLNPLLQNYWMQIHPPSLYMGYVSWTIPFAFAMAALATGKLDDLWIRTTRRWVLMAWFFLSLGNLFGARWAYEVLGWGGYWAWDPVENAAFMPWLTGTAYLHSVMVQERKDMLKVWNISLLIMTFALTIFGTFLTRSGVISSVHSFTQSGLGPYFLSFLALVVLVSVGLLFYRLDELRPRHKLDAILSRESAFLFNNLLLVGIAFATLWGTLFPVLSEWVRGVKITVGPPFFNKVNAPLGIALLFMTGVGPVIAWRRASLNNLLKNFLAPVVTGTAAGLIAFFAGMHTLSAILVVSFSVFVLYTIATEFHRGALARRTMVGEGYVRAMGRLVLKNQRRYGGYIVHIGVVMMFLGITMSSVYRVEQTVTVHPGETFQIGGYKLHYLDVKSLDDAHMDRVIASLTYSDLNGKPLGELHPEKRFYKKPQQPATEVAYRSTMAEDLYVILGSIDDNKVATFQAYINPLVFWLWFGGIVLVLGTAVAVMPTHRVVQRERARESAHAGRENA